MQQDIPHPLVPQGRVTFNKGRYTRTKLGWYDHLNSKNIHRSMYPDFESCLKTDDLPEAKEHVVPEQIKTTLKKRKIFVNDER